MIGKEELQTGAINKGKLISETEDPEGTRFLRFGSYSLW